MSNPAEIRIDNVSKSFGDLRAVDGVTLHIRRGAFYTFLGPSGCGKTTLLRIIAGFTSPDDGEVYLDDTPVSGVPPWKRGIGMVFQSFALWPHLSVFDNVAFGLRERRVPTPEVKDRVHSALSLVDLEGLVLRRPSQLSGGQQQRVALARTLVTEPRALLLDEPLSSLDARLRVQMRNELVRIQQEVGITTLYVTHDQEEALAVSTRIAVFSKGSVLQEGTPKEVYETPRGRLVADFVGISNVMEGRAIRAEGDIVWIDCKEAGEQRIRWKTSFDEPPVPGTPLSVVLRPEALAMSEEAGSSDMNRISATVAGSTYLGAVLRYDVEIAGGRIFRVDRPNPRRDVTFEAGTDVVLAYSPSDAVLLLSDRREA